MGCVGVSPSRGLFHLTVIMSVRNFSLINAVFHDVSAQRFTYVLLQQHGMASLSSARMLWCAQCSVALFVPYLKGVRYICEVHIVFVVMNLSPILHQTSIRQGVRG